MLVSSSLNQSVPEPVTALLNGLFVGFRIIPSIVEEVGVPKWSQLELNYQNFTREFRREQQ